MNNIKYYVKLYIELIEVIYIIIIGGICYLLPIPEIIKGFFALPALLIIPKHLGKGILFIVIKNSKINFDDTDVVTQYLLSWIIGAYSIMLIAGVLSRLNILNLNFLIPLILLLIVLGHIWIDSSAFFKTKTQSKNQNLGINYHLILLLILIGLTPLLLFTYIQPFPQTDSVGVLNHNLRIQRTVLNGEVNLIEKTYSPLFHTLTALVSIIFNVDSFSLLWAVRFLSYPLFSIGVYLFSFQVSRSKTIALMAAFFSVWVFYSSLFRHLEVILPRTLILVIFPFALFLIQKNILNKKLLRFDRNFLNLTLGLGFILLLIFIVRVILNSFRGEANMLLLVILPMLVFLPLKYLTSSNYRVFFYLSLIEIIFILIHSYESFIFLIILFGYIIIFLHSEYNRIIPIYALIILSLVFIAALKENILPIDDAFMFSKLIFKPAYGSEIIQYGFSEKYNLLMKANNVIITLLFVASGILITLYRDKIYLPVMATAIFSFFIYFLPESQFTRLGGIIPFFSLTISYGFLFIYKLFTNLHITVRTLITPFYILFAIIILFPQVSQPEIDFVDTFLVQGKDLSAIQPYEYEAALWIKENTPMDAIILSDPYSTILMQGFASRYIFITYGWFEEKEYRKEDIVRMNEIKAKLFLAETSEDAYSYAHYIRGQLSNNYSLSNLYYLGKVDPQGFTIVRRTDSNAPIFVVLSWRTTSWLTQDKMFITSWTSPLYYNINPKYTKNFLNIKYFEPVYNNTYLYIYRVKDS